MEGDFSWTWTKVTVIPKCVCLDIIRDHFLVGCIMCMKCVNENFVSMSSLIMLFETCFAKRPKIRPRKMHGKPTQGSSILTKKRSVCLYEVNVG